MSIVLWVTFWNVWNDNDTLHNLNKSSMGNVEICLKLVSWKSLRSCELHIKFCGNINSKTALNLFHKYIKLTTSSFKKLLLYWFVTMKHSIWWAFGMMYYYFCWFTIADSFLSIPLEKYPYYMTFLIHVQSKNTFACIKQIKCTHNTMTTAFIN